ncbi:hypothetical protein FEM48_Zijuj05G0024100 [Ziziphus jujuba var. spinosa]|uniref:DUF4283 domain-containing protein n=1 Tax=Ziziphus jujuba var. spinosa TaxID=714518 RepID=A0A978VC97_ZIZJJ|nr:hypothetical protein FEM48_Zijuj05G0024100 [Ziziphus jujuba var. spinosa]
MKEYQRFAVTEQSEEVEDVEEEEEEENDDAMAGEHELGTPLPLFVSDGCVVAVALFIKGLDLQPGSLKGVLSGDAEKVFVEMTDYGSVKPVHTQVVSKMNFSSRSDMEQSQPQLPCRNAPQLELVADEANAVCISQFRLVGKVFSDKLLRKNLVQSIIRRAWFTNDDVQVESLHPNIFLFCFKSIADRNRIWRKRPWSINGAHLALREWKPEQSFEDLDFNISTFWVQIHGLPLQFMTSSNASTIGGLFKNLIHCESTSRTNLVGLKYMRIQVDVDISKPLLTGHCKQACTIVPNTASIQDGDRYGPWIWAETDDNRVVQEAYGLRQVDLPSKDTYDSLLQDVHQAEQDEEVHQPTRAINSVEQESDMREADESTRIWTSSKEDHVMLQGQQQDNHQHPIAFEHVGSSSVSRKQGSDYSEANAQPTHAGKAVTRFEFEKRAEPSPLSPEPFLQQGSTNSQSPSTIHRPISLLEPINEAGKSDRKPGKRKRGAHKAHKAQPKALKSKLIVDECCKDTDHSTGSEPVSSLTEATPQNLTNSLKAGEAKVCAIAALELTFQLAWGLPDKIRLDTLVV